MLVEEAVEIMAATYKPLSVVALGLPVDAEEVAAAFAAADPDTVEYVCLKVLAELHPVPVVSPAEVTPEE